MSIAASVILKSTRKIAPGADGYGSAIADGLEVLDRIAKKMKVPPFTSYIFDELEADYYDIDHPKKASKGPKWYDCTSGIATIEGVMSALNAKGCSKWIGLLEEEGVDSDNLTSDLRKFLAILQKAQKKGDSFYLDVG
jgi:hypothetical protein